MSMEYLLQLDGTRRRSHASAESLRFLSLIGTRQMRPFDRLSGLHGTLH